MSHAFTEKEQQAFDQIFATDVIEFAQGQQDCKDNKAPQKQTRHYLNGYGLQYAVEETNAARSER